MPNISVEIMCDSPISCELVKAVASHNSGTVPITIDALKGFFSLQYAIYPASMGDVNWYVDPSNSFNVTYKQKDAIKLIFES